MIMNNKKREKNIEIDATYHIKLQLLLARNVEQKSKQLNSPQEMSGLPTKIEEKYRTKIKTTK